MTISNTRPKSKSDLFSMFGLLVGCILFGLGSLIVAHVETVGAYAMAFWRLLISTGVFWCLRRFLVSISPPIKKPLDLR